MGARLLSQSPSELGCTFKWSSWSRFLFLITTRGSPFSAPWKCSCDLKPSSHSFYTAGLSELSTMPFGGGERGKNTFLSTHFPQESKALLCNRALMFRWLAPRHSQETALKSSLLHGVSLLAQLGSFTLQNFSSALYPGFHSLPPRPLPL